MTEHSFARKLGLTGLGLFALAAILITNAIVQGQVFSIANTAAAASVGAVTCYVALAIAGRRMLANNLSLGKALARFRLMFDQLPQAILLFSRKRHLVYANKAYSQMYSIDRSILKPGLKEEDLIAIRRERGLPVISDSERITVELDRNGEKVQSEVWKLLDGRMIQFEHISTGSGGWIAQHRDVSMEVKQAKAVADSTQFLETILRNVPSAIVVKDARTFNYLYINSAVQMMNGWTKEDVVGKSASKLFPENIAANIEVSDVETLKLPAECVLEKEEVQQLPNGDSRIINSKRLLMRDQDGNPSKILIVIDDITERREAEQKITYLANHDALTSLKNRAWFNSSLKTVNATTDDGRLMSLILLDLDGFKNVNDTFGHAAGDMTLRTFATKIEKQFGADMAVARLGGDEFAIIVRSVVLEDDIINRVTALIGDVAQPMNFEDHRIAVNCSAGITFAVAGASSVEELFSQADIALYEAKNTGKATYCIFTPELGGRKLAAKALEMKLRLAIECDHLKLFYQPIVDAQTGEVVSMEALVRWFDPETGMIPPNDFIPMAEETGLIVPIGQLVLEKACATAIRWPDHVRISVNISPIQFRDLNLAQKIAALLERTGLPPTRLELEITEATLLSDDSDSLRTLNALRETGVRIVMDDFGTGYSSLNYIRSFPFDKIKIDKSYVDELSTVSNKSNVILHSVLSMARHLELRTTAEGVETLDQMQQLRDAGCTELQGYNFNKPMSEDDVMTMFDKMASGEAKRSA